jgi:hypothetical protein
MASDIASTGRGMPMTPVEFMIISSGRILSSFAKVSHTERAFCSPSGAQALALPLLTITARAVPLIRLRLVTCKGAAWTLLVV